jgi:hypothetical protein
VPTPRVDDPWPTEPHMEYRGFHLWGSGFSLRLSVFSFPLRGNKKRTGRCCHSAELLEDAFERFQVGPVECQEIPGCGPELRQERLLYRCPSWRERDQLHSAVVGAHTPLDQPRALEAAHDKGGIRWIASPVSSECSNGAAMNAFEACQCARIVGRKPSTFEAAIAGRSRRHQAVEHQSPRPPGERPLTLR